MRLPYGILKKFEKFSGIKARYLSKYANTECRPRPDRAVLLEDATFKMGVKVPREIWMFGTSEQIKALLMGKENQNES